MCSLGSTMQESVVVVRRPGEGKVAAGCDVHAKGSLRGVAVTATGAGGVRGRGAVARRTLA